MTEHCPKCSAQISARTGLCPLCGPPSGPGSAPAETAPKDPLRVGRLASFMTVAIPVMALVLFAGSIALFTGWKPNAAEIINQAAATLGLEAPPIAAKSAGAAPGAEKPELPPEWRVSGRAYDLLTLAPVDSVGITFTHKETGRKFFAATGQEGRFEVVMPPVKFVGYHVSIGRRGYRDIFFEEMSPPYHTQNQSRRFDALDSIRGSALVHVPIFGDTPRQTMRYDLILIPVE